MPSSKEFLLYVLDLLREVSDITYKKMMGEYILYKKETIIGGIYDDRFLLKKTESLKDLGLIEQIPYLNAKQMYLMESENPNEIKEIVNLVYKDLKK